MKKQFLYILVTVILTSCGEPTINGKFVDVFNRPITGADISIKGTSIVTKTNSNGEYSIDFIAGNDINVQFKKENYIDTTLVVSIVEKKDFPAETIRTYEIPKNESLYIINKSNYVNLQSSKVRINPSTFRDKGDYGQTYKYTRKTYLTDFSNDKILKVKNGDINILDASHLEFTLVKVIKKGEGIYELGYSQSYYMNRVNPNVNKTNKFTYPKQEFKKLNETKGVWELNLKSGFYVLTDWKKTYIFQVE